MSEQVDVWRYSVKMREAFPLDNPRSVPLIRLMAATNDTRLLQKQVLMVRDADRPPQNDSERLVRDGEAGYYGRMLLGHLYEAADAFRALDDKAKAWVTKKVRGDERAVSALARLRAAFSGDRDAGFFGVLGKLRNYGAFHYKDAPFRNALKAVADDGEMEFVVAQYAGFGRYALVDALLDHPISEAAKGAGMDLGAAVDAAIRLARDLDVLVTRLLLEHLEQRPSAGRLEAEETLPVPPALEREAIARRARRKDKPAAP